jgi:ribosomal protein L11 methyltransferase
MTVDWEAQWASFAENFYDGLAHIDLTRFGGAGELLLLPGPGFGDLSHPTTLLMLKLMQEKVKREQVVDIGCGSGILGLAALKLGARSLWGLDIDPDATMHSQKNAALNGLEAVFSDEIPEFSGGQCILLMNMILPEQKMVMAQGARLNAIAQTWITSGILVSQREEYLAVARGWGWELVSELHEGEWLGMVFKLAY